MAFAITFCVNNSNEDKIGKNITDVVNLTGDLKAPSSIIDPVLTVNNGGNISQIAGCNYIKIPTFNRMYFIREIEIVRAGIIQVTAHVDVLESYSEQILQQAAVVERQQNLWNLYLNDGLTFKVTNKPTIVTVPFPSGFTTQEFVLAVAGN